MDRGIIAMGLSFDGVECEEDTTRSKQAADELVKYLVSLRTSNPNNRKTKTALIRRTFHGHQGRGIVGILGNFVKHLLHGAPVVAALFLFGAQHVARTGILLFALRGVARAGGSSFALFGHMLKRLF